MRVLQFNRKNPESRALVELCSAWWEMHYGEGMTSVMMTDYGFMAFNSKNKAVFAGFFCPTMGTNLCIWGFQVSDPEASKRDVVNGFKAVSTSICEFAKSLGYKAIVCYPRPKPLQKMIRRNGYRAFDTNVVQYFKEL